MNLLDFIAEEASKPVPKPIVPVAPRETSEQLRERLRGYGVKHLNKDKLVQEE